MTSSFISFITSSLFPLPPVSLPGRKGLGQSGTQMQGDGAALTVSEEGPHGLLIEVISFPPRQCRNGFLY
ncbi:hypothetical protein E2C01_101191 [Portunus trituberculatus]|uniref:Uncharacterized protein n=1 Tax=Portunus trituberculatus TaxID=210409 RepID=A0A5B7KEZ8_PORTR|nr:hypothetical protein [Portunus trituberculatus]